MDNKNGKTKMNMSVRSQMMPVANNTVDNNAKNSHKISPKITLTMTTGLMIAQLMPLKIAMNPAHTLGMEANALTRPDNPGILKCSARSYLMRNFECPSANPSIFPSLLIKSPIDVLNKKAPPISLGK